MEQSAKIGSLPSVNTFMSFVIYQLTLSILCASSVFCFFCFWFIPLVKVVEVCDRFTCTMASENYCDFVHVMFLTCQLLQLSPSQVADFKSLNPENEGDYNSMYWQRTKYMDQEDSELSWFNAGVRVGVGIGLGVFIGIGVGVGLFVRSYRTTTRVLHRRLIQSFSYLPPKTCLFLCS